MKHKTVWLASAAAGVWLVAASGTDAKPVRHHSARPSSDVAALKAEVDALKMQVQALESRLDSQGQAQQQAQAQIQAGAAQAQAAQSQAVAAAASAQSAQSAIKTLPSAIATEVKKATPKPGWAADTTLGATMFADAGHISNSSNGVRTPQSGTNYDIKRLYLSVDHKFNGMFSANITTDFVYDSGAAATQLFIKKAYLQAKLSDALTLRAGAAELPWVPFAEKIYGYRYVEKLLIDRTNYGTTTDWGLHAFGSLAGGIIGYQVSVVDGAGFKKPAIGTANRTDSLDVEGRVNVTYDHVTVAVGGYEGKLGKSVAGTTTYNTAKRFDALAAYASDRFRLGAEYFWAEDWNDVTQANPLKTNRSEGYSVFGSFNFTPKIAVFGRYDRVKPQKTTAPAFTDNYFNVGLSYSPIKPLDFALVYKREKADNGLFASANGVVGGSVSGTYDEIGVFSQMKF